GGFGSGIVAVDSLAPRTNAVVTGLARRATEGEQREQRQRTERRERQGTHGWVTTNTHRPASNANSPGRCRHADARAVRVQAPGRRSAPRLQHQALQRAAERSVL